MIYNDHIEYGKVKIGENVFFYPNSKLGLPKEARITEVNALISKKEIYSTCKEVVIEDNSIIGADVIIYEGSSIQKSVIIEDKVRIGFNCTIGEKTRLMYGSYICDRISIGNNCKIAGFVCDGVIIGNNSTVMADLVHSYTVSDENWGVEEPAPIIGNNCVVGYNASIIGGITIGDNSYVAAGSIVTKNVPPNVIVTGCNKHTKISEWKGEGLKNLFLRNKK